MRYSLITSSCIDTEARLKWKRRGGIQVATCLYRQRQNYSQRYHLTRSAQAAETQGVCVVSYGSTRDFPAFYSRKSGHLAPYHVNSAEEVAAMIHSLDQLQVQSGLLLAVPVPEEDQLIDGNCK
ncbi:hypothetical protein J6590_041721 [Homalodisca vitripennis]|nr:hypothetical protein J6590_041721 [Homalodisca vitripennis]